MEEELLKLRYELDVALLKTKLAEKRTLEITDELSHYKRVKYEEVPKTGNNYTLQTDSLTHYRNGMTIRETKKRVSEHQTSNEEKIVIKHEFATSEPRLLEKMVHCSLPNKSNGEFFGCKLDHIKNVVDILGHTLDTVKSSSENMTKKEIMEKVHEKLELDLVAPSQVVESVESKPFSQIEQWVLDNIEFRADGILDQKELNNRRFVVDPGTKKKGKFRTDFERALKKLGSHLPSFDPTCKNSNSIRKWHGVVLKDK
jgi:nucleoid DNA-binding protein